MRNQTDEPNHKEFLKIIEAANAGLQEYVDAEHPKLHELLLAVVAPECLHPFPSCSIIQFAVEDLKNDRETILPKHSVIQTEKVGLNEKSYLFKTTKKSRLLPLQTSTPCLDNTNHQHPRLSFSLTSHPSSTLAKQNLSTLSFHLYGEFKTAAQCWHMITQQLMNIEVSIGDSGDTLCLPKQSIRAVGNGPHSSFLVDELHHASRFSYLHDYFVLPQKLLFFTLHGLDTLTIPEDCTHIVIQFIFNPSAKLPSHVEQLRFLLNCVPIINVYQNSAEPIRLNKGSSEYPLHISHQKNEYHTIFSVKEVTSYHSQDGHYVTYCPLTTEAFDSEKSYYSVVQTSNEACNQHFIKPIGIEASEAILSCELNVCDGAQAHKSLNAEDSVFYFASGSPAHQGKLLYQPSRFIPTAKPSEYQRILLSHVAVKSNEISSINAIKDLIRLHNPRENADIAVLLQSLQGLTTEMSYEIKNAALQTSIKRTIIIDDDLLSENDSIYLFSGYLHQLFCYETVIYFAAISRFEFLSDGEILEFYA